MLGKEVNLKEVIILKARIKQHCFSLIELNFNFFLGRCESMGFPRDSKLLPTAEQLR